MTVRSGAIVRTFVRTVSLPLMASALLNGCGSGGGPSALPEQPGATDARSVASAQVTLASIAGDAARGQRVFGQCRACHAIVPGQNLIGPSLHGVVGRQAGSVAGYAYSPANQTSNMIWDSATLFTYLEAPTTAMPGTKMAYALRDPQQRADVISYLETLK